MLSKTKHYVDLKPIKSIYHVIFESNLDWTLKILVWRNLTLREKVGLVGRE